jgi:uncharacterized protein YbaP (TraB family)
MKTIRVFFVAFFSFCFFSTCYADNIGLPFYEAKKDGAQVFVIGTMHLGQPSATLPKELLAALKRADKLLLELAPAEEAKAGEILVTKVCPDDCLKKQISEKAFAQIQREYNVGGANLERMPAWLAATTMSMIDYLRSGLTPVTGTEVLLKTAWGGKTLIGLETAQEQVEFLTAFPEKIQRDMVESYLKMSQEQRIKFARELNAKWKEGDAEKLFRWYIDLERKNGTSESEIRLITDIMLNRRNKLFVERLIPHLNKDKPIILAVGALHLGGEEGVLNLLKKKGFTVVDIEKFN